MIDLYICSREYNDIKSIGEKVVVYNDGWFASHFASNPFVDNNIKKLILNIDKCIYSGGQYIKTKFDMRPDILHLSTGCKTAINIYTDSNVIFSTDEAGLNAMEEILKFPKGRIVVHQMPILRCGDIKNTYRLVNINNHRGVMQIYDSYYKLYDSVRNWEVIHGNQNKR